MRLATTLLLSALVACTVSAAPKPDLRALEARTPRAALGGNAPVQGHRHAKRDESVSDDGDSTSNNGSAVVAPGTEGKWGQMRGYKQRLALRADFHADGDGEGDEDGSDAEGGATVPQGTEGKWGHMRGYAKREQQDNNNATVADGTEGMWGEMRGFKRNEAETGAGTDAGEDVAVENNNDAGSDSPVAAGTEGKWGRMRGYRRDDGGSDAASTARSGTAVEGTEGKWGEMRGYKRAQHPVDGDSARNGNGVGDSHGEKSGTTSDEENDADKDGDEITAQGTEGKWGHMRGFAKAKKAKRSGFIVVDGVRMDLP